MQANDHVIGLSTPGISESHRVFFPKTGPGNNATIRLAKMDFMTD